MLRKKSLAVMSLFIAVAFVLPQVSPVQEYIHTMKESRIEQSELGTISQSAEPVFNQLSDWGNPVDEDTPLQAQIKAYAKQFYEAPVNARIDPVWKAIPGYNGIQVDEERSLSYALQRGVSLIRPTDLFFKQIPPDIELEDLPPSPIYKGNPKKKMVSLMVNVAWGNEYLETMLDVFEAENIRTTFFLDGSWLKKNVETAKRMAEAGHEIANHAYTHKDMSKYSEAVQRAEISKTEDLLNEHLKVKNSLFAPPSGDYNQLTIDIAHSMQLSTILWTIDTVDWKNPKPDWIIRKVTTRLEPGSMILMHPTESSSSALQDMIRKIKQQGYVIGTVSELISSHRLETVESSITF